MVDPLKWPPEEEPKGDDGGNERLSKLEQGLASLQESVNKLVNFATDIQTKQNQPSKSPAQEPRGEPRREEEPPPDRKEVDINEQLRMGLYADPHRTLDMYVEQKNRPLLEGLAETRRSMERQNTMARHSDWKDFEADIEEIEKNVPPHALASPGAYEAIYNMVKGQKADELVKKAREESGLPATGTFQEGSGKAPEVPPKGDEIELSPDEDAMRAQFKMSKEEWMDYKGLRPKEKA